jgi:hypothetical protein
MQHYNVARWQCSASASDGIRSTKQTTAFMLNVGSDCARAAADERCCLAGTRARAQVHPEGSREWSGQAAVESKTDCACEWEGGRHRGDKWDRTARKWEWRSRKGFQVGMGRRDGMTSDCNDCGKMSACSCACQHEAR